MQWCNKGAGSENATAKSVYLKLYIVCIATLMFTTGSSFPTEAILRSFYF